jgi:hypothetical protein
MSTSQTSDRELYSHEIEWLLSTMQSALGERGTMGGVISAIERGGGGDGATQYAGLFSPADERMLNLVGYLDKQNPSVRRANRLVPRWNALSAERQWVHVHHYFGTRRAPGKVQGRFGKLAGVVVAQFCERAMLRRRLECHDQTQPLLAEIQAVWEVLEPMEVRIGVLRDEIAKCSRWAFPPTRPRTRVDSGKAFRSKSRLAYLVQAIRPLRSRRGLLLSQVADLAVVVSPDRDIQELTTLCERASSGNATAMLQAKALLERAEQSVRAAHRDWFATGTGEPEKASRVREREERVHAFIRESGL